MLSDLRKPNRSATRRSANKAIEPSIAVLVIACNRVDYVQQTLDELLKLVLHYCLLKGCAVLVLVM